MKKIDDNQMVRIEGGAIYGRRPVSAAQYCSTLALIANNNYVLSGTIQYGFDAGGCGNFGYEPRILGSGGTERMILIRGSY